MAKKCHLSITFLILLSSFLIGETLQQAYQNAGPDLGYDRLIILNPAGTYTGGLSITNEKVGIKGVATIMRFQARNPARGDMLIVNADP